MIRIVKNTVEDYKVALEPTRFQDAPYFRRVMRSEYVLQKSRRWTTEELMGSISFPISVSGVLIVSFIYGGPVHESWASFFGSMVLLSSILFFVMCVFFPKWEDTPIRFDALDESLRHAIVEDFERRNGGKDTVYLSLRTSRKIEKIIRRSQRYNQRIEAKQNEEKRRKEAKRNTDEFKSQVFGQR